tara:strand:+ start:8109 stop:8246 length:138 start_codon:yes stop_codon:yes gene_type:complete
MDWGFLFQSIIKAIAISALIMVFIYIPIKIKIMEWLDERKKDSIR